MTTSTFILTEGDDANDLAGSNVVSLFGSDEPMLLGDIVAGIILPDLAVRLSGDFRLPKVMAFAAGRDDSERP